MEVPEALEKPVSDEDLYILSVKGKMQFSLQLQSFGCPTATLHPLQSVSSVPAWW